ncbi:MAG: hypothetical protein ACYTFQ_04445 [Planctomycetota bacterium]|jgi:hypothetical protein
MLEFLNWCIGRRRCPHCRRWRWDVTTQWQNTRYVNPKMNLFKGCWDCQDENEVYWEDMWDDYYRGCM